MVIGPSSDARIRDLDVVLGTSGTVIDVRYQAAKELGDVAINMVLQNLRTKLGMQDLTLKTERIRPTSAVTASKDPSAKRKRQ